MTCVVGDLAEGDASEEGGCASLIRSPRLLVPVLQFRVGVPEPLMIAEPPRIGGHERLEAAALEPPEVLWPAGHSGDAVAGGPDEILECLGQYDDALCGDD